MMIPVTLASTSPYRAELLGRLGIPFERQPPGVDETARANESPRDYVARLAEDKAAAVADTKPASLVIGADQCAVLDERILGKPGTPERAHAQLAAAAGRWVYFLTAVSLQHHDLAYAATVVSEYAVEFRPLTTDEIARYVDADRPFDCAGAIRCESLGPALFRRMAGDDPTSLQGLPLIQLAAMLRDYGLRLP